MICKKCGSNQQDTVSFCSNCGEKNTPPQYHQQPPVQQPPPPQQPYAQPTQQQPQQAQPPQQPYAQQPPQQPPQPQSPQQPFPQQTPPPQQPYVQQTPQQPQSPQPPQQPQPSQQPYAQPPQPQQPFVQQPYVQPPVQPIQPQQQPLVQQAPPPAPQKPPQQQPIRQQTPPPQQPKTTAKVEEVKENKLIPILIIFILILILCLVSYFVIVQYNTPNGTEQVDTPLQVDTLQPIDLLQENEVEEVEEVETTLEISEVVINLIDVDQSSDLGLEVIEYIDLFETCALGFLSPFDDISQIDAQDLAGQVLHTVSFEYFIPVVKDRPYLSRFTVENFIHSFINENINFTDVDYSPISSIAYHSWDEEIQCFAMTQHCVESYYYHPYEVKLIQQDEENNLIHIDVIEYVQYSTLSGIGEYDETEKVYYYPYEYIKNNMGDADSYHQTYDTSYAIGFRYLSSQEIEFNEKYDELPIYRYTIAPTDYGFTLISKILLPD